MKRSYASPPVWAAMCAVAWLVIGSAHAAEDLESAERARIGEERAAAEARFTERDAECRKRFVVSSCLDAARQERRKTLDALRARQLVVDEARRRDRVQARRAELAGKSAEDAQRDQERAAKQAAAASAPLTVVRSSGDAASVPHRASAKVAKPPREKAAGDVARRSKPAATSASERAALEASHRAAFAKRQEEAAAHRAEVDEASARRLKQRPATRPLPIPAKPPATEPSAP